MTGRQPCLSLDTFLFYFILSPPPLVTASTARCASVDCSHSPSLESSLETGFVHRQPKDPCLDRRPRPNTDGCLHPRNSHRPATAAIPPSPLALQLVRRPSLSLSLSHTLPLSLYKCIFSSLYPLLSSPPPSPRAASLVLRTSLRSLQHNQRPQPTMSESDSFLRRRGIDSLREVRLSDVKNALSLLFMAVWSKTSRRMRAFGVFVLLL